MGTSLASSASFQTPLSFWGLSGAPPSFGKWQGPGAFYVISGTRNVSPQGTRLQRPVLLPPMLTQLMHLENRPRHANES